MRDLDGLDGHRVLRRIEGRPGVLHRQRLGEEPYRRGHVLRVEQCDQAVAALALAGAAQAQGGKSALYELVRELRPTRTMPIVRFEGLPGEFSQHDFGVVDVRYISGVKNGSRSSRRD